MKSEVVNFPGVIPRSADKSRAALIAERLAANLGNESVVDCADALLRFLAAMCRVNSINETEAIELAQMMAIDLETLTRAMLLPDDAPRGKSPIADALLIARRFNESGEDKQ